MSKDLSARLSGVTSAAAKKALRQLGVDRVVPNGVVSLTSAKTVAGPARTIRFLPLREDIKEPPHGRLDKEFVDELQPGDVLVVDALGLKDAAITGDNHIKRLIERGVAACVIDGVFKDISVIRKLDFPLYALGTTPRGFIYSLWVWETDVPIQCGGVFVAPGDYVVGDEDGVVVVPKALAEDVARRAELVILEEDFCMELMGSGLRLAEAFPMPVARRKEFEEYVRAREGKGTAG